MQDVGTIIHEFLHVLGAIHEHNRPDRDDHIRVNWENIYGEDSHTQFWKTTWQGQSQITSCHDVTGPRYDNCVGDEVIERMDDLPYDLDSIMHYPDYA